jgi:ABC transport system ATP-binding/permease protein
MNLISLEKAGKAYGPRVLLDGVSLGIDDRDRIGIAGRNGAGKSTLLALLAGLAEPDTGRVARTSGLRVGYLPQSDRLSGMVGPIAFGESWSGGTWEREPRARSVASELLFGISLDADASQLSGGERRRVALASLLTAERDILLLDEPTNHLDMDAIDWLGRHLRDRGCAVALVSHDRWLLDTVCDQMWEVSGGQVYQTEGGYCAYVLAQAERQRTAAADQQRRRNLARKELAWLRRGPQARGTKPKFRVQAASALIAAEPPARDGAELARLATARLGKTVLELEDVTVSIGLIGGRGGQGGWGAGAAHAGSQSPWGKQGGRTLLDHVTWQLGPGDRVGIVGVNGAGKTSLLRLLAGERADGVTVTGHVLRGKTVRVAHLSQELTELDSASPGGRPPQTPPAKSRGDKRVRESVEEIRLRIQVGKRELSAGQLLERLGFYGDSQWTPVGDLSGGERRRLQMLRLLMDEPNVLLLDEPTNDLDIEMLTEFEDLLDGWQGTLVVVSHDRYFLERVTDHVAALLGDGALSFLPGGVDEYLELVRARRAGAVSSVADRGVRQVSTAAADRAARKELQRLERQIDRASERESSLSAELAANATDYEKLTELGAQLRVLQAEKAGLEERWLEVASSLEG